MLAQLKLDPQPDNTRLLVAALLLLAAKVHEFRTPKFLDLIQWGGHEFGTRDLVRAEAELLLRLDFKVPVSFPEVSLRFIELETAQLEAQLLATPFQ